MTRITTVILPTRSCSVSDGAFLILDQTSIVKIVEAELNIEVREVIKADIITANINPANPKWENQKK